ncbi:hypothetical protein CHUAL_001880 [Chamberlinius hualienensis]
MHSTHHNHSFSGLNLYNLNMASAAQAHCRGYSFYYDSANGYIIPNGAFYHPDKPSPYVVQNLYSNESLLADKRKYERSISTSSKIDQSSPTNSLKNIHVPASIYQSSLPVQKSTVMPQSSLWQQQHRLFSSVEHSPKTFNQSFTINAILGHENNISKNQLMGNLNQLNSISKEDNSKDSYLSKKSDKQFPHKLNTKSSGKVTKSKRIRTIFTPDQLEKLEHEFSKQQYMVGRERLEFASSLNLTDSQVKVWFQNRRIKCRKQYHGNYQAQTEYLKSGNEIQITNTEFKPLMNDNENNDSDENDF